MFLGTGGPSWPEAALPPGSRESRRKAAGGPTGKSHPRTSGLAAFTRGTQPFQTEMRAMAALHSARKVRPLELGARGWGWGSPEGAALGPQSRDLRANKCLPASRAAAPAAGGPLLPETRAARPAPGAPEKETQTTCGLRKVSYGLFISQLTRKQRLDQN